MSRHGKPLASLSKTLDARSSYTRRARFPAVAFIAGSGFRLLGRLGNRFQVSLNSRMLGIDQKFRESSHPTVPTRSLP